MRSLWSSIGPISCHCHCFTCITNRHIQVRRLSDAIARCRRGRESPRFLIDVLSASSESSATWKRRNFRLSSVLRGVDNHKQKRPREHGEKKVQDESTEGRVLAQHPRNESYDADSERRRRRKSQEQELRETSSELHSLSIDHWSVDDVIKYEPMPEGNRPPSVPSTTTADPAYAMPQSPWAPDHLKRQNYARVWTRKKIAKMEIAMARFTVRVCSLLGLSLQRPSNLIVIPEAIRPFAKLPADDHQYLELSLTRHLNTLRNKYGFVAAHDPPDAPEELKQFIPKYEHFDDGLHHELLRDLNGSLAELFEGYKYQHLDFRTLMVKICHNLLVSSAPPNVQTMNILLLGFYSCDKYLRVSTSHVRHLILDWLIDVCRNVMIRPNEVTCATILATYRRRGMRNAFIDFILLMRGMRGESALMYTKDLTISPQSAPRLSPTKGSPTIFKQAVYPSPMIFAEIIKGVAKFYTLEDAVAICKDFTAKEWGYDWKCLHYLLNACIIAKDWESGLWVWEEIKAFRAAGHEEPVRILAAMLALCVQCEQKQMFASVLEYSTKQLKNISQAAFIDIATEIMERAVDRLHDDELSALEQRLNKDEESDTGHERHAFEYGVHRRLKDDPGFKRAVFGFGYDIATIEDRWQYLQSNSELSEGYDFKSLELEQNIIEAEESTENLHTVREQKLTNLDPNDAHDLLRNAEGGVDMEENDTDSQRHAPHNRDENKKHNYDVSRKKGGGATEQSHESKTGWRTQDGF